MKKAKTDYIKELENFSLHCMSEAENFNRTVNRLNKKDFVFFCIDELQNLTQQIKKEYFTPIDREDIFTIATFLSELYFTLQRLNSASEQDSFYPTEIIMISNFLLSATEKINKAIKKLNVLSKNDICGLLFEILKSTDETYKYFKKMHESDLITRLLNDCFNQCNMIANKMIYIYLKNT